jgi:hypothetical protein
MDTCGSIFTQAFVSGDDIELDFQFYQPDNVTPKPMTGYTVGLTVKKALIDNQGNPVPDSAALYQDDLPGDSTGLFSFILPGQAAGNPTFAPGNYYLDVKQWNSTLKRTTVLTTMLPINQSVTLRSAPSH